jgi:hypothetical protein
MAIKHIFFWRKSADQVEAEKAFAAPISPIVERVIDLLADPTVWTEAKRDSGSYMDLAVEAPCDVRVEQWSYYSVWFKLYVNGDEIELTKPEQVWIKTALRTWKEYDASLRTKKEAERKQEAEARALSHLDECLCA